MPDRALRLLALHGGGVRAVFALMTLEELTQTRR
jgi:hypothetical protein